MKRLVVPVLAYVIPTFILGYVWHLVLFERYYADLAMYRADIIIPFGFASMLIQAVLFALAYDAPFCGIESEPRLEEFCLRILRSGIVLELHHAGGRGQERDVVGARLSGHRNGLYGRSVGSRGAVDSPGFQRLEARPAAGRERPLWRGCKAGRLCRASSLRFARPEHRVHRVPVHFLPAAIEHVLCIPWVPCLVEYQPGSGALGRQLEPDDRINAFGPGLRPPCLDNPLAGPELDIAGANISRRTD